ncbi:MAG: hypothetical protein IAF94_01960 [Pirellulaceae bacterium]|nr:hypothetical protein [Pirellulaceae bacterium]
MKTNEPFQNGRWLVLVIALCAGCGQTAAVKEEPPSPTVTTNFERLPALLAGVQGGGAVSVHEGLPDAFWEPELRGEEMRRKKSTQYHGYPFYEETPTLQENDVGQLTACLSAPSSFSRYSGPKNAGEYNADYCISWKTSSGETQALVSLECAEVKLYGPNSELHCDLSPPAAQQLKQLLERYRKNRPPKE